MVCRSCLRKAPKTPKAFMLTPILQLGDALEKCWNGLPTVRFCRDLTASSPLFRFNIHLALTFHLVHVFIGRSFIWGLPRTAARSTEQDWEVRSETRTKIVSSCIQSALEIINLCQMLQDTVGLARASYTEFTTCQAALLVILAQRVCERRSCLVNASAKGIELIKHMALGLYTASSDKSAIQAMQIAIERLDNQKAEKSGESPSAYDQFREWAMLWRREGSGNPTSVTQAPAVDFPETYDTFDFASPWPSESFPLDVCSSSLAFWENEMGHILDVNQQ